MDFMHYGTVALGVLIVWLLYKVTRETRRFIESNERRMFREIRADVGSRRRTVGVRTRRG